MPVVKNLDTFLHRSHDLIQINPSTTRISITYGSQSKKILKKKSNSKVEKLETDNKSFIAVKVYNDQTGELYRYQTGKAKDLSKLMTALGPYGVQIEQPLKNTTTTQETPAEQTGNENRLGLRGFGSVFTNVDYKEDDELEEQTNTGSTSVEIKNTENENTNSSNAGSKKNKKKKGKK